MKCEIYNEGGKSSWNDNINTRPELVRLLKDVESKKVMNIWGWNMDRVGRNSESWWSILKVLRWKVNFTLVNQTNHMISIHLKTDLLLGYYPYLQPTIMNFVE